MSLFKIATWNVNSLRVRLPHVLTWLSEVKPDVLALQETKVQDVDFPFTEIEAAGYKAISSGQKTYNGVALLSRHEILETVVDFPHYVDHQRRLLAATINDIRIVNLYIPNGESLTSEKYQYKLNWLKQLDLFLKNEIQKYSKVIVVGDFNIAPHENDVHDPISFAGQVLCSEPERNAFQEMIQSGLHDCFRLHTPTEKIFTWWDYRLNAFKRNLGLRIDHALASQTLSSQCVNCYVDQNPRTWERPSDHAPVVVEFATPH